MTVQDHNNPNPRPLFEMPSGIDLVPEERHLLEPGGVLPCPEPADAGPGVGGGSPNDDADLGLVDGEMLLRGFDPEADVHRANKQGDRSAGATPLGPATRLRLRRQIRIAAASPGAHFVYALLALTVALGVLGLALTWRDGRVLAACAVITPLSFAWFLIRFRSWLNSAPYWYRLLTSLGENAEDLSQFRVRWAVRRLIRALYQ